MRIELLRAGSEIWISPPFNPGEVDVVGYQKGILKGMDPRGFVINKFPYETDIDPRLKDDKELKEKVESILTNHKKRNVMFKIYDPKQETISMKVSDFEAQKAELEDLRKKLKKASK